MKTPMFIVYFTFQPLNGEMKSIVISFPFFIRKFLTCEKIYYYYLYIKSAKLLHFKFILFLALFSLEKGVVNCKVKYEKLESRTGLKSNLNHHSLLYVVIEFVHIESPKYLTTFFILYEYNNIIIVILSSFIVIG